MCVIQKGGPVREQSKFLSGCTHKYSTEGKVTLLVHFPVQMVDVEALAEFSDEELIQYGLRP
jgi:hypothetical protein